MYATYYLLLLAVSLLRATDSKRVSEELIPNERYRRSGASDLGTLTAAQPGILNKERKSFFTCDSG